MDTLEQRIASLSPAKRRLLEQLRAQGKQRSADSPPITPVPREGELPLSFAQQRLWFLGQLEPDSAFYNVPRLVRIRGPLDADALKRSLDALVERQEAMRSSFPGRDGKPVQVIRPEWKLTLAVTDLSGFPEEARETEMFRQAREESKRPFDLERGPLFRARLLRLAADNHALVMTTHHIISDERSADILYQELASLYRGFVSGTAVRLPELPIQYADFAAWQRQWLQGQVLEEHLDFWRRQLESAPEVLSLPTDRPRPPVETFRGALQYETFSPDLRDALVELSRRESCTPFMTSLAAFALLLWRYTRQDDLVIGTVISHRDRVETENLIGFFLDTLPLRLALSENETFLDCMRHARQVVLDAYAHHDLPLEKIVEELRPERSLTHNPLFQVLFTSRALERAPFEVAGVVMQPLDVPTDTSKFDLAAFVGEGPSGLSVALEYNTDLFDATTIQRLLLHYRTLLEGAVRHPERPISAIPVLREEERTQLLLNWNKTEKAYRLSCVQEMFEAQALETPQDIALSWKDQALSYDQVNRRANQLARYLRRQNVRAGSRVALSMERSLDAVVAILGILKAGAAYVPLDPDYPKERLGLMLEDCQAPVLLTQSRLAQALAGNHSAILCLDSTDVSQEADDNFPSGAGLEDLVYVIFTSGSTGRPKGVCLPHRALSNLLCWQRENSRAGVGTRTLQFTSLSFDVSFQEIFSTLTTGGTLVLIDDFLRRDAAELLGYLRESQISRLFLPFIALQNLAEAALNEPPAESLSEVITAGEQLQITPQIAEFFGRLPGCTLDNHYGPSESHVVTAYRLPGRAHTWPRLPAIGTPIQNTQIYILDARLEPVPIGASGELYIGGTALATGYLNRPDLTAERFVPNPFRPGTSLYRTGDLARHRADGNIEYLGRADSQVKIRGYRVEPGEIEAILHDHPEVAASVIAVGEQQGTKYLVAYVVAKSPEKKDSLVPALRQYLQARLPEFMVPAVFMVLERLPLTPSGKVNRRALPAAEWTDAKSRPYVAPRTPVEETLAATWAQVLGLERVSIADNFFDLGGHSLLATQVISRITRSLGVRLPLRVLFERPSIAALAEYMDKQARGDEPDAPRLLRVAREDGMPLSFAQQRLWLLSQLVERSAAYNAPEVLRLRGVLDPSLLERSLNEMIHRHEVLRTVYRWSEDRPLQFVLPELPIRLSRRDLSRLPEAEREAEGKRLAQEDIRRPFDLAHGPILRALLLGLADQDHLLVLTFHHIAIDGWSMAVFNQELARVYEAFANGRPSPLPELAIQYADYAVWQRDWLLGDALEPHLKFWRSQLAGAPPEIDLPFDHAGAQVLSFDGARLYAELPAELVGELKEFSKREGATPFATMLSAAQVLLAQWTRQRDLVIGTIIAHRNRLETENLLGCFMNFLPLRAVLSESDTGHAILEQAKKTVLESYAHQDCPFDKLIEELNPRRSAAGTPIYNVIFLLQNFPAVAFENKLLEGRLVPMGMEAVHVDLRFAAGESSEGMWMVCDYRRNLFEPETIKLLLDSYRSVLEQFLKHPQWQLADFKLLPALAAQAERSFEQRRKPKIVIAATFTAEPIEESIRFWMNELDSACDLQFAPFNQVFQQLLDPHSELSTNPSGLNVVLLRLEDWWQQLPPDGSKSFEARAERVSEHVDEVIAALSRAAQRSPVPYLVCLCPAWRETIADPRVAEFLRYGEQRIFAAMLGDGAVEVITSADLEASYPVTPYEDHQAFKLAHIPYTSDFYTALGTAIARYFYRTETPPHKVIVLNPSGTLWRATASAPDQNASRVDPGCRQVQQFLTAQSQEGMLLCLLGANPEEDAWWIFDHDPGMLLRRDHIISWRFNSATLAEELRELSEELGLGLDQFIFLSRNPDEVAEVETQCPEVLSLELSPAESSVSRYLSQIWAFDHPKTAWLRSNSRVAARPLEKASVP